MNRSEINSHMETALDLCKQHHFSLPPFAAWSPDDWKNRGLECAGIIRQQLGWDITDFGSGDFAAEGLILFTIRNGVFSEIKNDPLARAYAEKMLIVAEDQVTPTHFHFYKTEDIINRGGGVLVIQLLKNSQTRR